MKLLMSELLVFYAIKCVDRFPFFYSSVSASNQTLCMLILETANLSAIPEDNLPDSLVLPQCCPRRNGTSRWNTHAPSTSWALWALPQCLVLPSRSSAPRGSLSWMCSTHSLMPPWSSPLGLFGQSKTLKEIMEFQVILNMFQIAPHWFANRNLIYLS